jgi:hypothetical protein
MYHDLLVMTPKKAAAYSIAGMLLAAWIASAVGVAPQRRESRRVAPPAHAVSLDALATDVQAQASRLRQRLATAPSLQTPIRNPFHFVARQTPRPRAAAPIELPPIAPAAAPIPSEPQLVLIGVAEQGTASGVVRTAMIAGDGDVLYMAREGEPLGTYVVVTVTADAVALKDGATGLTRRLILK